MVTVLIIIAVVLVSLILFLLLAPLRLELDTRAPYIRFQWWGIGKGVLYYDTGWKADVQVLFFHKTFLLEEIKTKSKKKKTLPEKAEKKNRHKKSTPFTVWMRKARNLLCSFTVERWQLALDTGDAAWNARLYPLSWMPRLKGHVNINFIDENYLYLRVRNQGWKLVWAYWGKK